MSDTPHDLMLGREVAADEYGHLDTIPTSVPVDVEFTTSELVALCPAVPGVQPDLYDLTIAYTAYTAFIESKSLKLWLTTFRNRRIFAEDLAATIGQTIEALDGIEEVDVTLHQQTRGGIRTRVTWPASSTR